MPSFEMKQFARWVAQATERYFEDPDVKRRFEKWKAEKEKMTNAHYEQQPNQANP
jgi:hypothetical protein